jgi:ABC-2 type transport system permease protein
LIYMTMSIGFIGLVIVLEAGPVYHIFMTGIQGVGLRMIQWVWLVGSFLSVLALCAAAVVIPMRLGARRISQDEGCSSLRTRSRDI